MAGLSIIFQVLDDGDAFPWSPSEPLAYHPLMSTPTPWHRLFGIALTDLFTGRPWRVELEKELALKGQRPDVLIIERRPSEMARIRYGLAHYRPRRAERGSGSAISIE